MKTIGIDGTFVGRQRDRDVVSSRDRGDVVEDSHLRAERVSSTDSHRRRLVDQTQFHVPQII